MKKITTLFLAGILAVGVLSGFTNSTKSNDNGKNSSSTNVNVETAPKEYINPNSIKDEDIFSHGLTMVELSAEATVDTFQQLYNNADLVMEFTVKEVQTIVDESTSLNSIVIPEDVKTYKGEYTGQKIRSMGGVMKYDEYMAYPQVKKQFEGRENPNAKDEDTSNKYFVSENEEFNPLYTKGDRVLIFLKKFNDGFEGESDIMSVSNAYQSTYIINENVVENKMFKTQTNDRLLQSLNQEMPNKMRDAQSWQFNKDDFIAKLESYGK